MPRIFGHIDGYPPGSLFASRAELAKAGVHRPTQAGISGSESEGADSIVLSGGYEDDKDFGTEILYTGQGGRDPNSGQQVENQLLNRGNLALAKSKLHGLPVRVIRGAGHLSRLSPEQGYRYDGLYHVDEYWKERGAHGHYVWRYRLVKDAGGEAKPWYVAEETGGYNKPERRESSVIRIVRDTKAARRIKELYDYRCQVCGIRLEGSAGPYAEAAHIRPLGRPHNGSDSVDNMLCLCPNHHVLFDYGAFTIADDFTLIGIEGTLRVRRGHIISLESLQHHQEHHFHERGGP